MDPAPPSAANLIRAELKRRGKTHRDLGQAIGETEANITKKLHRGAFDAEWFLLVMRTLGVRELRLD